MQRKDNFVTNKMWVTKYNEGLAKQAGVYAQHTDPLWCTFFLTYRPSFLRSCEGYNFKLLSLYMY